MIMRSPCSHCIFASALSACLALLACSGDTNSAGNNSPGASAGSSGSGSSSGASSTGSASGSGSANAGNSAGTVSAGSGVSGSGSVGAGASGSGATASGGDGGGASGGTQGGDAMASGGDDGGVDSGGAEGGGGPTFSDVYKILSTHCCSTCHAPTATAGTPTDGCVARNVMKNTGFTAGNLDMSTQAKAYTSLVGVTCMGTRCKMKNLTRVVAGMSAMSVMYSKITTVAPAMAVCGEAMPYDQAQLPAMDIATIKMWIDEGAPNN
jgi:hypothetical protein